MKRVLINRGLDLDPVELTCDAPDVDAIVSAFTYTAVPCIVDSKRPEFVRINHVGGTTLVRVDEIESVHILPEHVATEGTALLCQALNAARHDLATLHGLVALDAVAPNGRFSLDTSATLRQLDAALAYLEESAK